MEVQVPLKLTLVVAGASVLLSKLEGGTNGF